MITATWDAFAEKPVPEFEAPAPAVELASVLERYHADMDRAARAAAQGREQGLRTIAELAVLAVELEKAIDRTGGAWGAALRALTDRMLAGIAAAGLEVVRLRGLRARDSVGLVDVDSWRYDDTYGEEVVAEELEVAVRHVGRPLRRGRVVMGAPRSRGPRAANDVEALKTDTALPARARSSHPQTACTPGSLVCPVTSCGFANAADAEVCAACLSQLVAYRRLSLYPLVLFNRGLQAARSGDAQGARDQFAAAVAWAPDDVEIRNAYALACLEANDEEAARRAWQEVLDRAPTDARALGGLSRVLTR